MLRVLGVVTFNGFPQCQQRLARVRALAPTAAALAELDADPERREVPTIAVLRVWHRADDDVAVALAEQSQASRGAHVLESLNLR
jgi:hypothetical protein